MQWSKFLACAALLLTTPCHAALKVFQISQGWQLGPAVPNGSDNHGYCGLVFHNNQIFASWLENSDSVSAPNPAPARVPNAVFASIRVISPNEIVVGKNIVVSKDLSAIQMDPELAVDFQSPNHVSILSDNRVPYGPNRGSMGLRIVTSEDAGKSWTTNAQSFRTLLSQVQPAIRGGPTPTFMSAIPTTTGRPGALHTGSPRSTPTRTLCNSFLSIRLPAMSLSLGTMQ